VGQTNGIWKWRDLDLCQNRNPTRIYAPLFQVVKSIRSFTQDPTIYILPIRPILCVLMGMKSIPIHIISIEWLGGIAEAIGNLSQLGIHFFVLLGLQVYYREFSVISDRRM
jgi:hypothetical protein